LQRLGFSDGHGFTISYIASPRLNTEPRRNEKIELLAANFGGYSQRTTERKVKKIGTNVQDNGAHHGDALKNDE